MAPEGLDEYEIRDNICRELETMCGVETAIIFKQVGLNLFYGKKGGQLVFAPVRESSIFTQVVENKKTYIIN